MRGTRPLLVVAAVALLAALVYFVRVRHEMIDFVTWRQSAARALHGEPLYRAEDGHYQFKYFPAFAVVMMPFAVVDEETGKLLWFGFSVACLAALLTISLRLLPDRRLSRRTLFWLTLLLMAKFYAHELLLGQVNLLLGTLLVATLLALRAGHSLAAGALTGAAVFVKPYALILAPWLLFAAGAKAAAMAAGALVVGLLLPGAVYGWDGNLALLAAWVRTVTESTAPNLLGSDNVSAAAMWAKWLGLGPLASALAWVTIVALFALVTVAWRRRRTVASPEYLECALLMLLIPLVSPQGWDYVLLLATPAVVCIVDRWRELAPPWRWTLAAALAGMGLTFFDVLGRTLYGQFMSLSLVTVCALLVAVGMVHMRWRGLV